MHIVTAVARSFLHNQVRSMVGSLALVGDGKWSADDLARRLTRAIARPAGRSRRRMGFTGEGGLRTPALPVITRNIGR